MTSFFPPTKTSMPGTFPQPKGPLPRAVRDPDKFTYRPRQADHIQIYEIRYVADCLEQVAAATDSIAYRLEVSIIFSFLHNKQTFMNHTDPESWQEKGFSSQLVSKSVRPSIHFCKRLAFTICSIGSGRLRRVLFVRFGLNCNDLSWTNVLHNACACCYSLLVRLLEALDIHLRNGLGSSSDVSNLNHRIDDWVEGFQVCMCLILMFPSISYK